VPEDAKWHTYRFEFLTKPGQTSVVLKLENDAPGGYGNDLAIDNISFRPCGPKATIWPRGVSKVCNEHFTPYKLEAVLEGNQYKTPFIQWQHSINRGLSWTDVKDSVGSTFYHNNNKRGFYYYRYIVGNSADYVRNSKCRVTSKTKVIEVLPTFYSIADTICAGVAYPFGGRALTQSGTYSDSLISAYGCDSVVLLELFVDPDINIKATFKVTNPSCDYLNDGQIDIVNVINAKPPLMFYLNSLQSNESDFKNLAARSHQYRIVDRIGCNFDTSILLKKPEPFIIDLEPDADVKLGQSVQLVTTSNNAITHYEWSNRQDIDCEINCSPVEFYPPETMHVVLTATSDKKCSAKDSVRIQIEVARNIFLANTFSPNGDGLNEIFTPSTLYPQVKEFDKFTIFNRWGQVIYNVEHINPNDIAASWDGTDANPGIYAYYLEARFLDDVVLKFRGTLHLIR
ncbi:MAG: gliding motility-associated-like protein, partial [Bacteroidia bacterium]